MSATIELLAAPRMKDSELAENGVLAHKAALEHSPCLSEEKNVAGSLFIQNLSAAPQLSQREWPNKEATLAGWLAG